MGYDQLVRTSSPGVIRRFDVEHREALDFDLRQGLEPPTVLNTCPKCSHELRLGDPRPGRYKLKCPNCAASLKVRVFEEAGQPAMVAVRTPAADPLADRTPVALRSDVEIPASAPGSNRMEQSR